MMVSVEEVVMELEDVFLSLLSLLTQGLTPLQTLLIEVCPGLNSFSEGLQLLLPTLKENDNL